MHDKFISFRRRFRFFDYHGENILVRLHFKDIRDRAVVEETYLLFVAGMHKVSSFNQLGLSALSRWINYTETDR